MARTINIGATLFKVLCPIIVHQPHTDQREGTVLVHKEIDVLPIVIISGYNQYPVHRQHSTCVCSTEKQNRQTVIRTYNSTLLHAFHLYPPTACSVSDR